MPHASLIGWSLIVFRNVKGFKTAMRQQTQRLVALEKNLVAHRERYQSASSQASKNDAEFDGKKARREADHIKLYIAECEAAINEWSSVDDGVINNLANYKYWKPKGGL